MPLTPVENVPENVRTLYGSWRLPGNSNTYASLRAGSKSPVIFQIEGVSVTTPFDSVTLDALLVDDQLRTLLDAFFSSLWLDRPEWRTVWLSDCLSINFCLSPAMS